MGAATRIALAAAASVAIAGAASGAHAQDAKRTLLIGAQDRAGGPSAAITRALRSALADVDGHSLMAPAPLDLEAVQLAIECPDETAACLGEVAARMEARILVIPSVRKSGDQVALRLLQFDAEERGEPRTVVRRASGADAEAKLIEAVPGLVDELFGVENEPAELPAPSADAEAAPEATPDAAADDTGESAGSSGLPIAPLVIGGAGVAAIAAGLTVGLLMQQTEDDYAERTITTDMQAMAAEVERERGQRQAVVANVLFGVGIAAVVAAGVWLALDLGSDQDPSQTALVPVLGPRSAGLSLLGTWEESR
jgi:hypothetical protein